MIKSIAIRALVGAAALAMGAGSTALAAAPAGGAGQEAAHAQRHHGDRAAGRVISVTDTQLTIERRHRDRSESRDPNGTAKAAPAREDLVFTLNADTVVYRAGHRGEKLGHDALKAGERVRVRFEEKDGKKIARAVVILDGRDHRGHQK